MTLCGVFKTPKYSAKMPDTEPPQDNDISPNDQPNQPPPTQQFSQLSPPPALKSDSTEDWEIFKLQWNNYAIITGLATQS